MAGRLLRYGRRAPFFERSGSLKQPFRAQFEGSASHAAKRTDDVFLGYTDDAIGAADDGLMFVTEPTRLGDSSVAAATTGATRSTTARGLGAARRAFESARGSLRGVALRAEARRLASRARLPRGSRLGNVALVSGAGVGGLAAAGVFSGESRSEPPEESDKKVPAKKAPKKHKKKKEKKKKAGVKKRRTIPKKYRVIWL